MCRTVGVSICSPTFGNGRRVGTVAGRLRARSLRVASSCGADASSHVCTILLVDRGTGHSAAGTRPGSLSERRADALRDNGRNRADAHVLPNRCFSQRSGRHSLWAERCVTVLRFSPTGCQGNSPYVSSMVLSDPETSAARDRALPCASDDGCALARCSPMRPEQIICASAS